MSSDHSAAPSQRRALRHLAQFLRLLRPYWWPLAKSALLGPLIGLAGLAAPYLTKLLFDEVATRHDPSLLVVLVSGILASAMASLLVESLLGYYSTYLHIKVENTAVLHLFNHLQHLPDAFFYRRQSGDILSRFQDLKQSLATVSSLLRLVFGQGMYVLLVPPFLILLQWKLALIAVVTIPVTALLPLLSGRVIWRVWQAKVQAYAALESLQVETLRQIRTHKTLALERQAFARAASYVHTILRTHLQSHGVESLLRVAERSLDIASTAAFTWLGWHLILTRQMSLGDYVAFVAYVGYMRGPFNEVVGFLFSLQQRAVNLDRVFEYLDCPPEQDPATALFPAPPITQVLTGRITLERVSFQYAGGSDVLLDVDVAIAPATVVAIVGASGAGKTTLLRLLTRLETPDRGVIRFDGHDAKTLDLGVLRRQLAVVWQEVELYHGTLRHNLTLGLTEVSQAELDEALWCAGLDGLIAAAPAGLETRVAEWGASLSGGQRQRLGIARALLRPAPILLLDEATSQIDLETEALLLSRLLARARRRRQTVLLVTHRLSNATLTDEVWVFDRARLVARGPHRELLRSTPLYRRLYGLVGGGEVSARVDQEAACEQVA